VEQYHQMFEAGIISERDKVELINGELIGMSPKGSQHSFYITRLTRLLYRLLIDEAVIRVQDPIQLDNFSEPEPDVALCVLPRERYKNHHPFPEEVLLVVEVADSSLAYDKEVKLPLYAKANIPEVWLVDVAHQLILVAKSPVRGKYQSMETYATGEEITLSIGEFSHKIPISTLLG